MGCVASQCVWLKEKATLDTIPYQCDDINEGQRKAKENESSVTLKSYRTLFEGDEKYSTPDEPFEDHLENIMTHDDPMGSTDDEILSEDVLIHNSSKVFSSYSLSETSLNGSLIPVRGSFSDARISHSEDDEVGMDEVDETRVDEESGIEEDDGDKEEGSGNEVDHVERSEAEDGGEEGAEEEEEGNITYNVFENEGYLDYQDYSELKVVGKKMSIFMDAEERES